MKIGIQWPRGMVKLDVEPDESVESVRTKLSERIKIEPQYLALFQSLSQNGYDGRIDNRNTVDGAGIQDREIIYCKLLTERLPNTPVAQGALKANVLDDFIKSGDQVPEDIKNFQKNFGTRAINFQFFELRDSYIPEIISQTESSTYAIRVGDVVLKRFQIIALNERFATHRVMFLFGRVDKYTGKITVHCGMEPPQVNAPDHFTISSDFDMFKPCLIAQNFGMQCVGMAVSHPGDSRLPLPPYLLKLAAHFQVRFGEYFTTLVVLPNGTENVEVHAFQVMDAVSKLENLGIIEEPKLGDNQYITFNKDVRVYGAKSRKAHANICICAVRVRRVKSKIPSHEFPSPNASPTKMDLRRYLDENEYCPSWRKLFDFNLLVYLFMNGVLVNRDIPTLVNCIISMIDVPKYILDKIANFNGRDL